MSPLDVANLTAAILMLAMAVAQAFARRWGWVAINLSLAAFNLAVLLA